MKRFGIYIDLVFLLVFSLSAMPVFSQEPLYNSLEEIMNDIKSRHFEKPILYISSQLNAIERNVKPFNDDEYIGYTTLLSTCFVQNSQPYKADSILSHSIEYIQRVGYTSQYMYALHANYGGLLMSLENHTLAAKHLEIAVNDMRAQNLNDANFAMIISMLAVCHVSTGQLDSAKSEIETAISIIETSGMSQNLTDQMGIYQKAGYIYHEQNDIKNAIEYTEKAYNMAKNNDAYISEYLNAARNIATMRLNSGDYNKALEVLHEIENKPMFEYEKTAVFLSICIANYYLNNEKECVKYAQLCSSSIIENTLDYYTSFPSTTIEDIWNTSAMQLKLNMGILKKFPQNKHATIMSYENALFYKQLLYNRMAQLRNITRKNSEIDSTIDNIKYIRAELFAGDTSCYAKLNRKEKCLIDQLKALNYTSLPRINRWQDISKSLEKDEYAIEIISYSGWPQNENEDLPLRLGALILSQNASAPIFVDVCANDSLHYLISNALTNKEIEINNLYKKNNDFSLYNLVWAPIAPFVKSAKRIYISPTLLFQNINIGFIPCPNGAILQDIYDIHIVSSTAVVCNIKDKTNYFDASLYGGVSYNKEYDTLSTTIRAFLDDLIGDDNRGKFGCLYASSREVDEISRLLKQNHYNTDLLKGASANEISFRQMDGNSPTILHLSTHGFYFVGFDTFDKYFERLIPYSQNDRDMIKTGLLLADANTSLNINSTPALADGVLTAEEISWMDLSNTKLAVLSACETAIGQSLQEGYGGLLRAFKMAGVRHVVASLWKVPDEATADLMILFYKNMMLGNEPHESLIKAQREISIQYPDPYYWAAFIMLD